MANAEMTISYPIFHPVKRIYWTPDAVRFALMGTGIVVIVIPLNEQLSFMLRAAFVGLFVTHSVYGWVTMHSSYETLKGFIHGEIRLKSLEIIFEEKRIPITDIRKLTFNFFDREGQQTHTSIFKSINGQLSNGVKNSITIYFIDGSERRIFIQRKKSDDVAIIRPLLVEYCKRGIITFHDLASITCSSYKEVQELKAEYF